MSRNQDHFDLLPAEIILRVGELQGCRPRAHKTARGPKSHHFGQEFRGEWRERAIYLPSGCKISDLASFARTCKRHHSLINPLLHRRELEDYRAFGMFWAAKKGRLSTLNNFVKYGGIDHISFSTLAGLIFSSDVFYKHDYLLFRLFPTQGLDDGGFWDSWDKWWQPDRWRPHFTDWTFSMLAVAAMGGHDEVVARLLDCGADIDAPSSMLCPCRKDLSYLYRPGPHYPGSYRDHRCSWTPIHYAVCHGHLSTTKLLLSRGARHDQELIASGPTTHSILHTAAFKGNLAILEYLLDAGVVVVDQASNEGTALHFAVLCKGDISAVKKLVEFGADIDNKPPQHPSPTALACLVGNFEAALFLLDKMAETRKAWQFYREIGESDLISAVQKKAEDFCPALEPLGTDHLESRQIKPIEFYLCCPYDVWKKQQSMVLQRLRELKEQADG